MATRTTSKSSFKKSFPNVQSTLEYFQSLSRELENDKECYVRKRATLGIQVFVVIEDCNGGVPSTPDADENAMRTEINQLLSHINELKLLIVSHKIDRVAHFITRLEMIAQSSQATPAALLPRAYEEWLENDDDLAQWQLQLLRVHEFISTLKRRRVLLAQQVGLGARRASKQQRLLVSDSITTIQQCIASFVEHIPDSITMQLNAVISPTQGKVTPVSRHIDDYIDECARYREIDSAHHQGEALDPQGQHRGCHPERYQNVMEGLVDYLLEVYESRLGLDRSSFYLILEGHIMPRVKNYALPYVRRTEDDRQLARKYEEFQHITLANISENKVVQSGAFGELLPFADAIATLKVQSGAFGELLPFADAIATLKASYFSSNPTKKLHSIAKAAELVLKRLHQVFKVQEVDGDLVLDVWVYILIKAKMKDLATTLAFLEAYSDPAMNMSQLGYCLTNCSAAMRFIMDLTPDQLKRPKVMPFVTCERSRFAALCSKRGSPFTMVTEECMLRGYKMAVIPHWMFDSKRFYRSFLVKTGQDDDIVSVAVVRAQDMLQDQQKEFIYHSFTTPPYDEVKLEETPHGLALVLDQKDISALSKANSLLVPCEIHFDDVEDRLAYVIALLRLGSEKVDLHGTPPSYQAVSRLQVPTPANVGPFQVPHPRPVTMGLKSSDVHQTKERDTGKAVLGMSAAVDCQRFLDPAYVRMLENNFIRNHLKGELCDNPRKKAKDLVQEAQVHLKLLNFLSQFHPSSGVYCDATVDAVQRFQEECNKLLGGFPLPSSGHLTSTTLHRLRGDMLDITSKLTRLGYTDFPDPLNQSVENIAQMREAIALIQRKWQLTGSCRKGVLCRATLSEVDKRMHILANQSYGNKTV